MGDVLIGAFIIAAIGLILIIAGTGIMDIGIGSWMEMLGRIITTAGAVVMVCPIITVAIFGIYSGVCFMMKGVGVWTRL